METYDAFFEGVYDAFFEGVDPGGLRKRKEINILICYIVCRIDGGITKNQLTDILCKTNVANYFDISQAMSDVVSTGNIRSEFRDGEEFLYPTDFGRLNTSELEDQLPYTVKETALNATLEFVTRLKREQENKIEIAPHGSGFDITISVMDNDDRLLSVTLFVADEEQARTVKKKFLDDPVKFYSTIVALLMA